MWPPGSAAGLPWALQGLAGPAPGPRAENAVQTCREQASHENGRLVSHFDRNGVNSDFPRWTRHLCGHLAVCSALKR